MEKSVTRCQCGYDNALFALARLSYDQRMMVSSDRLIGGIVPVMSLDNRPLLVVEHLVDVLAHVR